MHSLQVTRSNSKEEILNGDLINGIPNDSVQGLETVIEGNAENGINHQIEPLTNGNHKELDGDPDSPNDNKSMGKYSRVTFNIENH